MMLTKKRTDGGELKRLCYMTDYAAFFVCLFAFILFIFLFFQCPSDDHVKDGRTCEGEGEVYI